MEYSELPSEGTKNPDAVPEEWISKGAISFQDVTVRYGEHAVLRSLNFSVIPGERIGIVGRTGAGKSSLISALFRLVECSEGTIRIDDVDISRISLHDLRRRLAIIPQEPALFQGSLLSNLDPFGESTLEEVRDCCLRVQLILPLTEEVAAGGANISVGERQLVCIARALLRGAKILVLDEATASIDTRTDKVLQKVMRSEFGAATVLIVAHRLNTIIDCDRVLVLNRGELVELDTPAVLVQREASRFAQLVGETGEKSARHLTQLATSSALMQLDAEPDIAAEEEEDDFYSLDSIRCDFEMRAFPMQ